MASLWPGFQKFTDDQIGMMMLPGFYKKLLAICLILTLSNVSWSQDDNPAVPPVDPGASATDAVSPKAVEALRALVEASANLSEEQKAAALDSLQKAATSLTATSVLKSREQADKEKLEKIDELRDSQQEKLDALKEQPIRGPGNGAELLKLEQELNLRKSELAQAQSRLAQIESQVEERTSSQRALKERLTAIPVEKEALQEQLAQLPMPTEVDLVLEANRMALRAERQRLDAEPTQIQTELSLTSAEEAAGLLQLRRQFETLLVERLKQEIQRYTDAVNLARRNDAKARRELAEEAAAEALASGEDWRKKLAEILLENVAIVSEELDTQLKLQKVQTDVDRVEKERALLEEELQQLQSREGRTGTSRSFGVRLREQRKQLPDSSLLRRQIRQRLQKFEDAQLRYFDLREDRKKLDDFEAEVDKLMRQFSSGQDLADDALAAMKQTIRNAYEQQRESLDLVVAAYDKYIESLDSYDSEQLRLAELSDRFDDYINERVLWIRSHEPLTLNHILNDFSVFRVATDGKHWARIASFLVNDFWNHLFLYSLFIVVWGFLIVTQAKQVKRIHETGKKASSRLNTSMKPTVQALLMTLSKSLPLPLPVLFFGWRLFFSVSQQSPLDAIDAHLVELAWNLLNVSYILFSLELIRNMHRQKGVAQAHFGWSQQACEVVFHQGKSFLLLATPLIVIVAVLNAWSVDDDTEALSRVFALGIYSLLALSFYRLTKHQESALSPWVEENKNGWIDRFATLFHLFAVALPLAMAVLTAVGFTYATDRLAIKVSQTVMLLFGVLCLRAIMLRWLILRQRRLAVDQARQARAALAESGGEKGKTTIPEVEENKAKLAEISTQARRLLNVSVVLFSVFGIWAIWHDVVPALYYFDTWTLPGTSLRLPSLIMTILIAILTTTAARNVPGLLEITLLEWLPLEKSSRYAIGAVTQYCIAIIGLLAISEQVGVGWEQLQWLAAALTFGLGFGLQEIFANFVSGLIILFEQPVRVGDVVTIDGVSGVVNRIRIRSTTITDWDRKEYIVPNREFITGKLLNWTLTDTTNRITIMVGVAYGTDPQKVHGILAKLAEDHPVILKDPEPIIVFNQFGDSSLNFTLYAFLPSLENRLRTIHEMHVGIHAAFAEAGIEIPFPQRDLHLRSSIDIPLTPSQFNLGSPVHAGESAASDLEESSSTNDHAN